MLAAVSPDARVSLKEKTPEAIRGRRGAELDTAQSTYVVGVGGRRSSGSHDGAQGVRSRAAFDTLWPHTGISE